jgi:hypothetical protein
VVGEITVRSQKKVRQASDETVQKLLNEMADKADDGKLIVRTQFQVYDPINQKYLGIPGTGLALTAQNSETVLELFTALHRLLDRWNEVKVKRTPQPAAAG